MMEILSGASSFWLLLLLLWANQQSQQMAFSMVPPPLTMGHSRAISHKNIVNFAKLVKWMSLFYVLCYDLTIFVNY